MKFSAVCCCLFAGMLLLAGCRVPPKSYSTQPSVVRQVSVNCGDTVEAVWPGFRRGVFSGATARVRNLGGCAIRPIIHYYGLGKVAAETIAAHDPEMPVADAVWQTVIISSFFRVERVEFETVGGAGETADFAYFIAYDAINRPEPSARIFIPEHGQPCGYEHRAELDGRHPRGVQMVVSNWGDCIVSVWVQYEGDEAPTLVDRVGPAGALWQIWQDVDGIDTRRRIVDIRCLAGERLAGGGVCNFDYAIQHR